MYMYVIIDFICIGLDCLGKIRSKRKLQKKTKSYRQFNLNPQNFDQKKWAITIVPTGFKLKWNTYVLYIDIHVWSTRGQDM